MTPVRDTLDRTEPEEIEALRRCLGLVTVGNETSEQRRQEGGGATLAWLFCLAEVLE
jgi:hypothetical protein